MLYWRHFGHRLGQNMDATNNALYLRPNIVAEPLIDGWYAWTHLIPPATAARNITERHLKIMESYLECPEAHDAAVQDPAMAGGPYMHFDRNREDDVRTLRDRTLHDRKDLIELSRAIEKLDELLRTKAKGFSLDALYAEIPPCLQGMVEIVYDLNNQPSFRLIQPLLYRSRLYDDAYQSVTLSVISADDRPFVMSTPRLEKGNAIQLQIPFASERYDQLFRMKREPAPFDAMRDALELSDEDAALFRTFLTSRAAAALRKLQRAGRSLALFRSRLHPSGNRRHQRAARPGAELHLRKRISRYTYDDLPDVIDYVLITHNHQDHILFETLLQLRHRIRTIIVPRNGGGALQDPSLAPVAETVRLPQRHRIVGDGRDRLRPRFDNGGALPGRACRPQCADQSRILCAPGQSQASVPRQFLQHLAETLRAHSSRTRRRRRNLSRDGM